MEGGHGVLVWLIMMIGAAVPVPPPTDVEVICQNLNVQARWRCNRADAQSSFVVNLKRNNRLFVERSTVEHQYDLTQHIWSSEDAYMSIFHVTVTATVGGNRSEPASSRTFTFNNVNTAAVTCGLDFPPAELVRKGLQATLSFSNPFHFYRELKQASRLDSATFSISVTSDEGSDDFVCSATEETCKRDMVVPERSDYCVTLVGTLFAGDRISQISVKKSDRICAVEAANLLGIMVGVLLGIVILAGVLIVVIIVAEQLNAPVVSPTAIRRLILRVSPQRYATISPEVISIVHSVPRKKEPSLSSSSGCQESEVSVCSEDGSSEEEPAAVVGTADDEPADSEVAKSGYNHGHTGIPVDMGDGDIALAYRVGSRPEGDGASHSQAHRGQQWHPHNGWRPKS